MRSLRRPFARLIVTAIGLLLLPAGISRANAVTSPTFDPVVRVEESNPSSGGTGTLIAARQVGGAYGMVFLAADHTLERVGPLSMIGFGNLGAGRRRSRGLLRRRRCVRRRGRPRPSPDPGR